MQTLFVYCTCSSVQQAQEIGKTAIEKRLAACANIIPTMQSIYRWKGEIVEDSEVVLFFKTTEAQFEALKSCIVEIHSYEVPCVIAFPITHAHQPYLNWILSESMP